MKSRVLYLLLAIIFAAGCVAVTTAGAPEPDQDEAAVPSDSASLKPDADEPEAEDSAVPEPVEPPLIVPAPSGPPDEPSAEPSGGDQPGPSAEPSDETSNITVQIEGSGSLEVYSGGSWNAVESGSDVLALPMGSTQLRAIGQLGAELESVTLNDSPVEWWPDETADSIWLFQLDRPAAGSILQVKFSTMIPVNIDILGPGTISKLEEGGWVEIESGENALGAAAGTSITLAASPARDGYAATGILINNQDVTPAMYSVQGAVFTLEVEGPACDVAVTFEQCDQIKTDIGGEGTVYYVSGDSRIEIQDEASFPYGEKPLQFELVPAAGYAMSGASFNSQPLIVTVRQPETSAQAVTGAEAAPEVTPAPAASGAPGDALPVYTCAVADPTNGGILSVSFLAADDALIEWIRGVDSTSGISWAVPLGTSVYGVSNVTPGSKILVTRLTQGSVYNQASSAASRYGSVYTVWDISLVDAAGRMYEPTVPVLMNMPIPSGYPQTASGLRMLHILTNGQIETVPIEVKVNPANNVPYISMRATSLSSYVLVNTNSTVTPTGNQQTGTGTTVGTSPQTGDESNLTAWWLVAVGAGVLMVLSTLQLRSARR